MNQGCEVGYGEVVNWNFGLDGQCEDKSFESSEACHQLEASGGHIDRKPMPGAAAKIEFFQVWQVADAVQFHWANERAGEVDRLELEIARRKLRDIPDPGGTGG